MLSMKTTKILSAVSAAALLGISSFALAQSGGGPGSSGAPAGNTMQKQQDANPGSTSKEMNKDSMSKDSIKSNQAQQDKGMSKDSQKSQAQQDMSKDNQKSRAQSPTSSDSQKSQAQSPASSDKSQAQSPTSSGSQKSQTTQDSATPGATVGAAGSGAVNLTTEQRTTIRQTVLTSNAPRATNINFAINVGTVVPSSVRVVEVPDTIVRIQPRWKGYRYFVYNDEIIIVEPRTLKIVAVLDV
jgi:hypothetical protein